MIVTVNLHHHQRRKGAALEFEVDGVQHVLLSTAESQPWTVLGGRGTITVSLLFIEEAFLFSLNYQKIHKTVKRTVVYFLMAPLFLVLLWEKFSKALPPPPKKKDPNW